MINFPKTNFDLFIDVGLSYNAPHSVEVLNSNLNAFVIGIEPHPGNCISIKNCNLGNRFHLIEAGASDRDEILELNMMHPDPGTSSFLELTNVLFDIGYSIANKVKVPLITLESVLDRVPWNQVTNGLFDLKSDTQGFEEKVIRGLKKYISKVRYFQVESTTKGQYSNSAEFSNIYELLKDYMTLIKEEGENAWFVKK